LCIGLALALKKSGLLFKSFISKGKNLSQFLVYQYINLYEEERLARYENRRSKGLRIVDQKPKAKGQDNEDISSEYSNNAKPQNDEFNNDQNDESNNYEYNNDQNDESNNDESNNDENDQNDESNNDQNDESDKPLGPSLFTTPNIVKVDKDKANPSSLVIRPEGTEDKGNGVLSIRSSSSSIEDVIEASLDQTTPSVGRQPVTGDEKKKD
jgi:hypothetical protein